MGEPTPSSYRLGIIYAWLFAFPASSNGGRIPENRVPKNR